MTAPNDIASTGPAATAVATLNLARDGRFEEIRDMFAAQLRPMVPVDALRAAWDAQIDRLGPVRAIDPPIAEPAGGLTITRTLVTFARGQATLIISVADGGQLAGIQVATPEAARPTEPWQPPSYADPAAFDERDVTLGTGPLAVPGILSLPRATGPHPAVVLLAGSGAGDRDGTLGRNKPLKDLAWGLAAHGVAVLRFDKVTRAHPELVADRADFTVVDEYLDDAIAAVHLLAGEPTVDPARVFVLGHSLGGTVAPRVAAAEPTVAGLVILAGGAQPLHWAIVRQLRHIAALDPANADTAQPAVDVATAQATAVDSPDLSPATPRGELPFGVPAAYWLDLRDYDPVGVAASLDKPMLILQGRRDYQVTVADDLARWTAGLGHRPDVTVRVYDEDNHLFFRGTGTSTPAEYEPVAHVDPTVVADVAAWLTGSPAGTE